MSGATAHPSTTIYIAVFVALLLLLGLTVGIAEVDFGPWNFPIAGAIATAKAVLIMLYFMHVRYSPALIWLVAAAGFFWLAILFSLTMADFLTRSYVPLGLAPQEHHRSQAS
jgi:cytochrome c oxidase subunit 4